VSNPKQLIRHIYVTLVTKTLTYKATPIKGMCFCTALDLNTEFTKILSVQNAYEIILLIHFGCNFRLRFELLDCSLHGLGLLASSKAELTTETTNPFQHFGRIPCTGNRPIARILPTKDSTAQGHAWSGIRNHDPSIGRI
jgi:hypothetical protein